MFDLFIYPFGYRNREEYSNLTGYFVGNVHRKATRTRVEDIIVMRFSPFKKLSDDETDTINQMVSKASDQYYKTKGPITTAAKIASEFFNNDLSRLNIKNPQKTPILGSLHLVVLNKEDVYFVQSGGATSYHLTRTRVEKFEDRTHGVEGIGVGKSIKIRFFHSKINESDRLILSTKTPKTWTKEALLGDERLSISQLRRSLMQLSQDDFEAVIIQFRSGDGSVHQLKLDSAEFSSSENEDGGGTPPLQTSVGSIEEPVSQIEDGFDDKPLSPIETTYQSLEDDTNAESIFKSQEVSEEISRESIDSLQISEQDQSNRFDNQFNNQPDFHSENSEDQSTEGIYISGEVWETNTNRQPKEPKKKIDRKKSNTFAIFLFSVRKFFHNLNDQYGKFKTTLTKGLLKLIRPSGDFKNEKDPDSLSSFSMLMIAILAAVFVSAIGITVYMQSGVGSQQRELIANANLLISDALDETDVNNQILMYQEALRLVTESESFGKSESTTEIKKFIQAELDDLQDVTRIEIQPTIFGGLDKRIKISRMGTNTNGDVYALDSGTGRVIRMIATRPDYVIDNSFVCGPGKFGEVIVDALIDIEPVNYPNKLNTTLMGIDTRGNLIMCIPGSDPIAVELRRSDTNWGEIKALAFNGYSLYVLDAGDKTRDIYRYSSNEYAFDQVPESLFSGNIPENLANSLDITVNQEELFLVHASGQLTRCNLNQFTCENNIGYGLIVDGKTRENFSVLPGSELSQVIVTLPPDPSIYFLDMGNQAIYHFSMALNLQQQISPNIESQKSNLDESSQLTAFTVNPNGIIHFAYGHLIYFGYLP